MSDGDLLGRSFCKAGNPIIKWGIINPEKLLIATVIQIPYRLYTAEDIYELWKGHGRGETGPMLLDPIVFN